MKDGKIDAAFIVAGAPTTAITELATTNGVYMINIDGAIRDSILSDCPYYTSYQIPAGTYPGQDEPVETITVKATIVVSESLDEDTVYDMTAAIFDHADDISAENAKGGTFSGKRYFRYDHSLSIRVRHVIMQSMELQWIRKGNSQDERQ